MRISGRLEYQIVSFAPAAMRVCKFRKHGQKYRIVSWNTVPCENGRDAAAMRKALEENGGQIPGCMILTGAMESGTFFTCPGASLNVRAQRSALEFELPLHMLQVPKDCVVQFSRFQSKEEGESDQLNVYAFDPTAINHIAQLLTVAKSRADEFIYPLLGIRRDDPPVCLPEVENGFCWQNGEWIPFHGSPTECNKPWGKLLETQFEFPVGKDFDVTAYLPCLLAMRFIMSKDFALSEQSVRIMPPKLRPSRCRSQMIIAACLLLVLAGGWGYRFVNRAIVKYNQYSVLVADRDSIRQKNTKLTKELKNADKEEKELDKLVKISAGDPNLLNKLYDMSVGLPEDALVTNFRFSDSRTDLAIQTENRNVDLSQTIAFSYWKISTITSRNVSDTVLMVNMSLIPVEVQ